MQELAENESVFGVALEYVRARLDTIETKKQLEGLRSDGSLDKAFAAFILDKRISQDPEDHQYNSVVFNTALIHIIDVARMDTSAFNQALAAVNDNLHTFDAKNYRAYPGTTYPANMVDTYFDMLKNLPEKPLYIEDRKLLIMIFMVAWHYLEEINEK